MKANIQKIDKKMEISAIKPPFPQTKTKERLEEIFNVIRGISQAESSETRPLTPSSPAFARAKYHQPYWVRGTSHSAYLHGIRRVLENIHRTIVFYLFCLAVSTLKAVNSLISIRNKSRIEEQARRVSYRSRITAFYSRKKQPFQQILESFYYLLKNKKNINNNANKLKD